MQTVILRFNLIPLLCMGLMMNSQEVAPVNKVLGVRTSQKQSVLLCTAAHNKVKHVCRGGWQKVLD